MVSYQLDYVIEEVRKSAPTAAQRFLMQTLDLELDKDFAAQIVERIDDHKWYMSERMKRDVGMRVAAVDFFENVYEPSQKLGDRGRRNGIFRGMLRPIGTSLRSYFVAKSMILPG